MEWKTSLEAVPYEEAVAFMEARARAIREGGEDELVWLLEHPALYTAGTGANDGDLLDRLGLPVYKTGRGGQYTYHGPGQRVAYVMLDLKRRTPDVRLYVQNLERWIIAALADFGVKGWVREGRVGVWVNSPLPLPLAGEADFVSEPKVSLRNPVRALPLAFPLPNPLPQAGEGLTEAKIAAIGVRIRQWVTYHGISLNVHPDLGHYRGIVPCGISDYGVTSLAALGIEASIEDVDAALRKYFAPNFPKPNEKA